MGFSRFMVRKGKVNYTSPLNFALQVDSVPPKFNLGQNKRKNENHHNSRHWSKMGKYNVLFLWLGVRKRSFTVPICSIQY